MDPVSDDRPVRLSAEERRRERPDIRLPAGGRHYENIHLEDSPHYQGEFVLHFDDSGNGSFAVNLDAADVDAVRTAVTPRVPAGEQVTNFGQILRLGPATTHQARDFLIGLMGAGAAPGEDWAHGDFAAIERVIALLDD